MGRLSYIFLISLMAIQAKAAFPKPSVLNYQKKIDLKYPKLWEDEGESFWSRVSFGGNIGLQFGNPTNIILSPAIGYIPKADFLNDRLMIGFGITYMYNKWKYYGDTYESNIWGGRLFTRVMILENFFGYAEYELLNSPPYYINVGPSRVWVNSFFLGGGYLMRFSQRGGIMITVLYNLAWRIDNPVYGSPWNFRIGFML